MSMAAARTTRLKFGMSVMVLPGRNPVILAKELATLDRMSGGRLLPAFGLGVADPVEQQAFGVERAQRARIFDEALRILRLAWSEETFSFHGEHFHYDGISVQPKPVQTPPEVWLGGIAESELRRVGRMADGWLPAFVTPEDARTGWEKVNLIAAGHDRAIDPEHFGVLIPFTTSATSPHLVKGLAARRPDLEDPSVLVPSGWSQLADTISRFVDVGASKFVVVPFEEPADVGQWRDHLARAATELLPLQT
jgi:probable F420-dependent oxidoreductase